MLFHLNAPESGEGSARVKSPAEMRGVRRRVRLCRKCRRRQVRSAAGHTRAIRRAPLIRAAFRGLVKIDDETLRTEVSSSIPPRPPGGLEWNAGENGEMRSWEAGKWVQKKVFCACWRKALEKMTWRNH